MAKEDLKEGFDDQSLRAGGERATGDRSAEPVELRVTANATKDLQPTERYCTCCEQPITRRFAWLELDQRINAYHDLGEVPSEKSQGWFPFGLTCARKMKKVAIAKATGAQS